ncbi:MAG: hypothetical protein M4579_002280 [Chaenotheca gracillima]|nr:MAG: hypothetical protein M4579_002280 [Chaenotheca gracillima]
MATSVNLAILSRWANPNGGNPLMGEYQPNTLEYTHVASAINIARAMLSTEIARRSMTTLARRWDQMENNSRLFGGDRDLIRSNVDAFVDAILSDFPFIVVDFELVNPDVLAYHPRGNWDGLFVPRDQAVVLNASRLLDMGQAGQTSPSQFRIFQFQLANTLVHEVGAHVFVTYLGNGRPITPPISSIPTTRPAKKAGSQADFWS